jgi:single-strand DNA-binding protein
MVNEAYFSVTGYVATEPKFGFTRTNVPALSLRIGWTPRRRDEKGDWADEASSFASVTCFRKVAENAAACLRRGDPIVVKGTLRVREYQDTAGVKRVSVDIVADAIGHDLSRGITTFSRSRAQLSRTALDRWREEHGLGGPAQPDDEPGVGEAGTEDQEDQAYQAARDPEYLEDQDRDEGGLGGEAPERADAERADSERADPELAGHEIFDEDEAIEILAEAEPVGAAS